MPLTVGPSLRCIAWALGLALPFWLLLIALLVLL